MKKMVIIILIVLPIFLVITISFAGRIFSYYQHISVEKIRFVDYEGIEYDEDFLFIVNVGEQRQTNIKVFPEFSTNKKVSYSSNNEEIFVVDNDGVVTGVSFGTATLIAISEDGSKIAKLLVKITQDRVTGVSLPYNELEIIVGNKQNLTAIVTPYVALNKYVEYFSSDTSIVEVNSNGTITAVSEGQAIITVRTDDGGFEDTCVVTCKNGILAMRFDFSEDENFTKMGEGYKTKLTEINLLNYLQIDTQIIIIENVNFRIKTGGNIATLNNGNLVITGRGLLIIVAYVGSQESTTYQAELRLMIE